jgi:ABC-type Na+ efflux pump permease subunit
MLAASVIPYLRRQRWAPPPARQRALAFERDSCVTILPICRRDLMTSARRGRLQSERAWFAGTLLLIVLGTFAAWYISSNQFVGRYLMSRVAAQSFLFVVCTHAMLVLGLATLGALSIARELDRRTLGFVLATRLGNAEIILGKLAVCLAGFFANLAAGLPVMILLHVLGGVHHTLILLSYGCLVSTGFFVLCLAIWISTEARDARRAANLTVCSILAWLMLPFFVGMTPLLTRIGIRLPAFVLTLNAWVLASNPLSLLPLFLGGGVSNTALFHKIGWMSGLQLCGGVVFLLVAIARLRRAYRTNVGGDGGPLSRRLSRPAWRLRPRPPVSDDPILWREMYTSRGGILGQLAGFGIAAGVYAALGYVTFFFARRALVELWHHGYLALSSSTARPELNLIVRFFLDDSGPNAPVDAARVDFNLFLRYATGAILFGIALICSSTAAQLLATERAKDTWNSLIATPLSGRDILLGKLRAALWRLRGIGITILTLWTLGLLTGAIHPLGFLAAVLTLATSTGFYLVAGLLAALKATDHAKAAGQGLGIVVIPISSAFLPFFLPAAVASIAWGVASTPLIAWLSLVSYREASIAWQSPVYPLFHWVGFDWGDGTLMVVLTCAVAIITPALLGRWLWNFSLANFDRMVGRPCRDAPTAAKPRVLVIPAPAT